MRLLSGLLAELYANIAKHTDQTLCVTFDTDAIHVSASDATATGPSSKHAAAPSKPAPDKPTGG
ncbi:MAG: hypothetical protein ACLVG8_00910 [Bifidobacterium longum]